jgi:hypothetical protein
MRPFVRAATELGSFGVLWCAAAVALVVAAVVAGAGGLKDIEVVAVVLDLGLSVAAALGGLLLAKRTGPEILYARIFDRARVVPRGVLEHEPSRATALRAVSPGLSLVAGLLVAAPVLLVATLIILAEPRDEILDGLPAAALLVAGGWSLTAGAVSLRVAAYFRRWERRKRGLVLCHPRRAGLLSPVYVVVSQDPLRMPREPE